jgi:Rrf2 family transcriptional regulator, iron-sulfur cluster assembly transcription factor
MALLLNKTTQYGLQVLAYLASHPGEKISGKDLAAATGVPWNYLVKILRNLGREGFVSALKGWGGGFSLKPSALKRSIAEVVDALDSSSRVGKASLPCLFGWNRCGDEHPCPLHDRWSEIVRQNEELLNSTTIRMLGEHMGKVEI